MLRTPDNGMIAPKPMLAKSVLPENVRFPCYVQPKLDGVRCLWDGQWAWTRNGLLHSDHIQDLLRRCTLPVRTPDGELVLPPREYGFDQTLSAVTREQPLSNSLRFAVFDTIPAEPSPFKRRLPLIDGYGIETRYIRTITEFEGAMEDFTRAGHEGIIVRDPDGVYTAGKSSALLKYKTFNDAEFRIVDVISATGKDQGTAVFVCVTTDGLTFNVRPSGDFEERSIQFEQRESAIGRMYTVRFQELTNRGIPRFPTGVAFRPTHRETTQV